MKAELTRLTMTGSPARARFVLDGIAGAVWRERGIRPRAFMADVKDRRATITESLQEIDDPRHRVRIVAPPAGRFPFVEGALDVDDDEGGVGAR
jgi:hypothetical protein